MSIAKAKLGTLAIAANTLRIKLSKSRFVLSIQILSLILVCLYIIFFYKLLFPWYAYTVKRFMLAFFVYLAYGIGCNFGLFFITTTKARRMRVLATILYSPTVHGYASSGKLFFAILSECYCYTLVLPSDLLLL